MVGIQRLKWPDDDNKGGMVVEVESVELWPRMIAVFGGQDPGEQGIIMGAMWGHVIRFTEGATERFCNVGIGYFVCNMGLSITNLIIIKSPNVGAMLDWLKTRTYRIRPASHESFLHPVRHMSRYTYCSPLTIM